MSEQKTPYTVTSAGASFRWDEVKKQLVITTQSQQVRIGADKVMELLETLYQQRDDIIESARAMPSWARDTNAPADLYPRTIGEG